VRAQGYTHLSQLAMTPAEQTQQYMFITYVIVSVAGNKHAFKGNLLLHHTVHIFA